MLQNGKEIAELRNKMSEMSILLTGSRLHELRTEQQKLCKWTWRGKYGKSEQSLRDPWNNIKR